MPTHRAQRTIVVSDPRLKLLVATESRFVRVTNNVHHGDSIKTNHLFEIDEAPRVAVGEVERRRVVGSVPV